MNTMLTAMVPVALQGRSWTWGSPATTLTILVVVLTFALTVIVLGIRASQKNQRMKLMERALQAKSVDDKTRLALLDQLSGRNKQRPAWLTTLSQHLLFLETTTGSLLPAAPVLLPLLFIAAGGRLLFTYFRADEAPS